MERENIFHRLFRRVTYITLQTDRAAVLLLYTLKTLLIKYSTLLHINNQWFPVVSPYKQELEWAEWMFSI